MKNLRSKFLLLAVIVAGILFVTSCGKNSTDKLSVTPGELIFSADETQAKTIDINTNAFAWDADRSDSWVQFSKSGSTLSVSVEKYTNTNSPRTASITIRAGSADPVTIQITQNAKEENDLSVNPTSLFYEANETGDKIVSITTNAESWDANTIATWLHLTKEGNTLKITVPAANTSASELIADIIITAGNAIKTLQVKQASPMGTIVTGEYYGDLVDTGTAFFTLDIYNATDDNTGFMIMGFCDLPSNFANFKLTSGTYSLASTGATKTFFPGKELDDELFGTLVYDITNEKLTLVTGGTFTVEMSGDNYTITTNFTGEDYATGTVVNNIRLKYTGTIAFEDRSGDQEGSGDLAFEDIVKSTYTATGTPSFWSEAGPKTWTGQVLPQTDEYGQYYSITNWGGVSGAVYCDFIDGKIFIDGTTKLAESSDKTVEGYFRAIVINETAKTWEAIENYEVKYDKTTKTLDFSGTYKDLPVLVGVIAKNKSTNALAGSYTDLYANAKLKLTASGSMQQLSGDVFFKNNIKLSGIEFVPFENLKGYKMIDKQPKTTKSPAKMINKSKILQKIQIK